MFNKLILLDYLWRNEYFDIGYGWLVGWLVGFFGISTIVGYLTPNPILYE